MTKQNLGYKWVLTLGIFGFLVGFVGPMIFAPSANQGPLLGIFITGPTGVALGAVFWILSSLLQWSMATQRKFLFLGCAVLLASVLAVALAPKDQWLGRIYQVRVLSCQPVTEAGNESSVETEILTEKVIKKRSEKLWAFPLTSQTRLRLSFYVSESCATLPVGFEGWYFVSNHATRDKAVLKPVPDDFKKWIP